jgi:NAD(P)-dependent dehydrogenase (short-subunit alcohol dehydrogenase family)
MSGSLFFGFPINCFGPLFVFLRSEKAPMRAETKGENVMALLKDKVAIVTGSGSGIGRAVAIRFAQEGGKVVVSDINESGGNETVSIIESQGGSAIFIFADVAKTEDNNLLVDEAVKEFGTLDIAVNNAGIGGPLAPTGEYPLAGWEKVIAVNLTGVFYGMRYQIPAMLKNGGGAIVNISSILGSVGFANAPAYTAAKHGLLGLTKVAALEYSSKGLRINVVGPGFIKTPMVEDNLDAKALEGIVAKHPIGRLGDPAEVAELVLWLSSDQASFVTGGYYPIDGGYLAQ